MVSVLHARSRFTTMATRKYRKRRKKGGGGDAALTVTLQPGEVPTDEELEAEAKAIDAETQGRYELAKKDEMSLSTLQHMSPRARVKTRPVPPEEQQVL